MHAKWICTSRIIGCSLLGRRLFPRVKQPINQKRHARVHVDERSNSIVIHQLAELLSKNGRCKVVTLKHGRMVACHWPSSCITIRYIGMIIILLTAFLK